MRVIETDLRTHLRTESDGNYYELGSIQKETLPFCGGQGGMILHIGEGQAESLCDSCTCTSLLLMVVLCITLFSGHVGSYLRI
jgi:hypothetical protein